MTWVSSPTVSVQQRGQVLPFAPSSCKLPLQSNSAEFLNMARPLRIEFPGAVYHVTSRGDRREPIVLGDEDREDLLGVLGQALQRPASITVQGDANQTLMSRSYQYDPTGNITQIVSDLGTTQFSYDPVGRLTQAKPDAALQTLGLPVEQYGYDRVHNRISSAHQPGAWSYNADNQLTQYPAIHNGQA